MKALNLMAKDFEQGGFHEHFAANQVSLHARDNLHRAKGWLGACLAEHTACSDFQGSTVDRQQHPTRVIEITGENSVKLRCNMQQTHYNYLALSHMWGTNHNNQIRLVKHRLNEFEVNIPWEELSAIYKEAIRATLALGYRYIWIDSLCIVQDSNDDWKYEAQRMAIVYGNAVCNLAFLFPPSADTTSPSISTPIHQPRADPRIWNPCILRQVTPSQSGVYIQHLTKSWRQTFPDEKQDWLIQRHWPLFARAWTFQEYLLAPRTLLLGHKNLMWQCSTLFYDELLGPIAQGPTATNEQATRGRDLCKGRYFPEIMMRVKLAESLSAPDVLSFMLDWHNIVNEYRTRALTFSKDRVIAFAGVARAYQTMSGLTYLAGMWWDCFPLSLLWFVEKKPAALVRGQNGIPAGVQPVYTAELDEPGVQDAPTWSWFSVPIYRFYRASFLFNDDELPTRYRALRTPGRVYFDDIHWARKTSFRFGEHAVDEVPDTGLFDFSGLRVELSVLTWPVENDLPADLAMQFRRIQAASQLDEDLYWSPIFKYFPDAIEDGRGSPPTDGIFVLITEFQIVRTAGDGIQRRFAGLVLIPASQPGTWRRIGVWKLKIRVSGVVVTEENIREVARRWRDYQLTSERWRTESLTLV
jgi:hypothetical protein